MAGATANVRRRMWTGFFFFAGRMSASACEKDRCGGDVDGSVSLNIDGHDGEDDGGSNGRVGDVSVDGGGGGRDGGGVFGSNVQ